MYGYVRMGRRGEAARQRIGGIWLAAATVPERGLLAPLRRRRIWRRLRKWGAVRCVLPRQLAAEAGRYGLLPVEVHRLRQAVLPQLLALQGDLRRQTAALRAAWVSPAVREAAMVLAQRARYLTLAVDSGGAALARELRERFGLSTGSRAAPTVTVSFGGAPAGAEICLGEDCQRYQQVTYQLRRGGNLLPWEQPEQLLAVLYECGEIKKEEICVKTIVSNA